MREDTEEICDLLDKAADLIEQHNYEATRHLLAKITKLVSEWVERHLSP